MHQKSALLILDMLNPLDFPEGKQLLPDALKAAKKIKKLKERCRKKKIPVLYLNDNFGKWHSNWPEIYDYCIRPKSLGKDLAKILKPEEEDYFILKPKHSGFFQTSLEILLDKLKISNLIITGIAGNICVLFTAHDAHMREFKVQIPKDCIASNTRKDNSYVLNQFKKVFDFNISASSQIRLPSP